MNPSLIPLQNLLSDVRACKHCRDLPLGPRPVVKVETSAKILVIGQAPGTKVHASGIPWNDSSGDRLRSWMGLSREQFYNTPEIAIMPMGFCYQGKGKSGDLPPRAACAPKWHQQILEYLPNLELTLLIGQYAQQYYLNDQSKTLTERVRHWEDYLPSYLPLVHPSPRNHRWLKNNPWFEQQVIPFLRVYVAEQIQPNK